MKLARLIHLGGVAPIAIAAMIGTASATTVSYGPLSISSVACPGCSITVQVEENPLGTALTYTEPTSLPFTPLDLGTNSTAGYHGTSPTIPAGSGISSISFVTGTGSSSGVYSGGTTSVALSPFGGSTNSATPMNNYLVAEGGGGSVTINYTNSQTTLDLLWGTVDTDTGRNVTLTTSSPSDTISGADIINAVNAAFGSTLLTSQIYDVGVEITGLQSFTSVTMSDTSSAAFEFDVAAVPAPVIGHGLPALLAVGGLLFGVKLMGRGRNRSALAA
jgi:hypothetical protein